MQRRKEGAPHRKERTNNIQKTLFRTQFVLIISLAVFLGVAGMLINLSFENEKRDQNLKNIAETIARSPMLTQNASSDADVLQDYLDPLKDALGDIDVISVVDENRQRIYHSNHALIGTEYDGTIPGFEPESQEYYAADEDGPSGRQRRAYAAVYMSDGEYAGFVMAIMLRENIMEEFWQTLLIFLMITVAAVLVELMISAELSSRIKASLMGHEPDVFSAMYRIRDHILESLDEGIIATDGEGTIQFANSSAHDMLADQNGTEKKQIVGRRLDTLPNGERLLRALTGAEKEFHIQEINLGNADVLIDRIPIQEEEQLIGTVGILHNRTEYTKLMEDLTGTRYLVDSMRANNHDFTNKLHVILGLIQMEMYDEAVSYIENITMVQRETISAIMHAVTDPALAALLIGKSARASELNVKFALREGSCYSASDMRLPSEVLVTIAGNLIDNAFDAMNESDADFASPKQLVFGVCSGPDSLLISAVDTGNGIAPENMERIFENGYSTKGSGRGTGLYLVKNMVEGLGGSIHAESQQGVGTSIAITFGIREEKRCTKY